jgi:hypothetical protein
MLRNGNRTIKVNKEELIKKIRENKEAHIIEYKEAVEAYKKEAYKQLDKLKKELDNGNLNIYLNLTVPINCEKNYDDILEMFIWEQDDIVELSQSEFREYVQDETDFARSAKMSNTFYMNS